MRDTAGVRMWLDIGHHKSYDGTKMSYQKTPRIKMIVASEPSKAKLRQKEIQEIDKKASKRARGGKRRTVTSLRHTQKGWQRIRELVRTNRVLPL